jgi:hypothetical protein
MDLTGDITILVIIATIITSIIEIIKAWVPCKYKDSEGLVLNYKNGTKQLHIPSQAIWPTLSILFGIGFFVLLKYNVFAPHLADNTSTEILSGAASGLGSNGTYRIKNKLGSALGGNEATNAQNTGPTIIIDDSNEIARMLASLKYIETTTPPEPTAPETCTAADNNFF